MKTVDLFAQRTVLSFEVFPPRRDSSVSTIYKTIDELKELHPDFISVTYGAGGSDNCAATIEIASAIKHRHGIESVAHLPALCMKKEQVREVLQNFQKAGIENVLALRGDLPEGHIASGDFPYASSLVSFIHEEFPKTFNVIGAAYPEGHFESPNTVADIKHLKQKVDAGVSQLITQLFFNNDYFYRFHENCELSGIDVPIEAGIMPVVNKKQIERMVSLCKVQLPRKFLAIMERYEHDPIAMRDAGIAYAIDQIVDLVTQGVSGIHLYTMNNPYIAKRIYEAVHTLIAASRTTPAPANAI